MTQAVTYSDVQAIYNRNLGSLNLYQRPFNTHLIYTDGVMDFAKTLNASWVIDNVISYMPKIINAYKKNIDFSFLVVDIVVDEDNTGYMEVYGDTYTEDGTYNDHVTIIKQDIFYIDLPCAEDKKQTTYKFFLELCSEEPINYTLLLPSEH